jgi:serine/threonine protein kinase
MAPQVLQRIDYTRKCDVWSIGIIFYELLCGQLPWMGRNEEGLLNSIMTQPLKVPSTVSQGVKEILEGMLAIS